MGVCDLDKKTQDKQTAFRVALSCMNEHVFGCGRNLSHWGTSSKRVLAFCKTKLQAIFTIPPIGSKIYSSLNYNISHKNLDLVLAFATHKSIQPKMNSKLSCSKLKKYQVV